MHAHRSLFLLPLISRCVAHTVLKSSCDMYTLLCIYPK